MITTNAVTPIPIPTFAPVLRPEEPDDEDAVSDGETSVKLDGTEDAGVTVSVFETPTVDAAALSTPVAVGFELKLAEARVSPRFKMIKAGLGNWFGNKG